MRTKHSQHTARVSMLTWITTKNFTKAITKTRASTSDFSAQLTKSATLGTQDLDLLDVFKTTRRAAHPQTIAEPARGIRRPLDSETSTVDHPMKNGDAKGC